jgi:hypothetical protein
MATKISDREEAATGQIDQQLSTDHVQLLTPKRTAKLHGQREALAHVENGDWAMYLGRTG